MTRKSESKRTDWPMKILPAWLGIATGGTVRMAHKVNHPISIS